MSEMSVWGIKLQEIMLFSILGLLMVILVVFVVSVYLNRDRICFYSLVVCKDGSVSKVGIAFLLLLLLITYQVFSGVEISSYLVELLGVIFAAELGKQYFDNKLTKPQISKIKDNLTHVDKENTSVSAKNLDDIDFDKL